MNTNPRTELVGVARAIDARDRQLRDEIRGALMQSGDEKYIDLAGQVHDLGDEAVANELIEVQSTLIDRHLRELREIEVARERLARGEIDECIECGGEIGFKRLMANLVAIRCLDCQARIEKNHAHAAMPKL